LVLTWSDGTLFRILNSWEQYETYTISHGQEVFVV